MSNVWINILKEEQSKPYYKKLIDYVDAEYAVFNVYPEYHNIFRALRMSKYEDIKVVILGQDPYYTAGLADGLSFSVNKEVKIPRSLSNIFKELRDDLGIDIPVNGDLSKWAKQGVLLLNNVLTVREGEPNSHKNKGWETFTCSVIKAVSFHPRPVVFILWGRSAQDREMCIGTGKNLILESSHPSPHSASLGFFGSKPFSKANNFLREVGRDEIDWRL